MLPYSSIIWYIADDSLLSLGLNLELNRWKYHPQNIHQVSHPATEIIPLVKEKENSIIISGFSLGHPPGKFSM